MQEANNQKTNQITWLFFLGLFASLTLVIFIGWNLYIRYETQTLQLTASIITEQQHADISYYNEVLRMSANLYAITQNKKWKIRYQQFEKKFKDSTMALEKISTTPYQKKRIDQVIDTKTQLIKMETLAITLTDKGEIKKAQDILLSNKYDGLQTKYQYVLDQLSHQHPTYIRLFETSGTITRLDEILTMSARMATLTSSSKWEDRYNHYEIILTYVLNEALNEVPTVIANKAAINTDKANMYLVKMERQAFQLIKTGNKIQAQKLLFSKEYEKQKQIYAQNMQLFLQELKQFALKKLTIKKLRIVYEVASTAIAVLILLLAWILIIYALKRSHKDLLLSNKKLHMLNINLDKAIENRTANIHALNKKLNHTLSETVRALGLAMKNHDSFTTQHQTRTAQLAQAVAEEMKLDKERIHGLYLTALIHDVGKLQIPLEILNRPGPLTELEFNIAKDHSRSGHDILANIDFPWPIADIILQHHERMDGSGYPQGLKKDEILLEAKILSTVDVIEAMLADRPYRPAHTLQETIDELKKGRGTIYDAEIVDICINLLTKKRFTFN